MISKLLNYLENKKILILGFGVEGKSTYKFLRKNFPEMQLTICDTNKIDLSLLENVEILQGEEYLERIEDYDIIMKSPGISFKDIDITNFKEKIKSQIELLLEFVDVFTIGVTGTKGKSTTSSLIYEVLKEQNKNAVLLGNIGTPIFEYIEKIEKDTIIVLELSSHALEYMKLSPNISILLNVFEEHLDHYKSLQNYIDAKYNIFKYQRENDYAIYNADNELMKQNKVDTIANLIGVSMKNDDVCVYKKNNYIYYNGNPVYDTSTKRNLQGEHNLNNIAFVMSVASILKLNLKKAQDTINNFKPLEHRLEYVGKYNDIEYYNDSIATIPEATINGIETLKNVNTVIIGGKDRGVDLLGLIDYLKTSNVENIICLPKTGHDMAKQLNNKKTYIVNNLEEAVCIAKKVTQKNTICLLSPAASSYGYFKNFEERGNLYKSLVRKN